MFVHVIRLLVAAPLVALLGAAMALDAWPDGDVTSRDRELVARLTRGGVQRFETDGGHWSADAVDSCDPSSATLAQAAASGAATASAPVRAVPAPSLSTMLDVPTTRQTARRLAAAPARGRAPPLL